MAAAAQKLYDYQRFEEKKRVEIKELPKKRPQTNRIAVAKIVLFLMFVAVSLSVLIYTKAIQTELNNAYETTKTMVTQAQNENARLQVELEKKLSLTNVEQQARAMDMGEMQQRQINYVRFETENKVVVSQDTGFFQSAVAWIKGLFQ